MILREREAMEYMRLGRTKLREVAAASGAVLHFGRAVRYDSNALDAAVDKYRRGGRGYDCGAAAGVSEPV